MATRLFLSECSKAARALAARLDQNKVQEMALINLVEDEQVQQGIIAQSGILKKLREAESKAPPSISDLMANGILLTIPLISCYFMLDYLVLLQFDSQSKFGLERVSLAAPNLISLLVLAVVTEYFKKKKAAQIVLALAAVGLGIEG